MSREQLLLELRNAICDKEWTIACANMETSRGGWTCNWYGDMRLADEKVAGCLNALNALNTGA